MNDKTYFSLYLYFMVQNTKKADVMGLQSKRELKDSKRSMLLNQ